MNFVYSTKHLKKHCNNLFFKVSEIWRNITWANVAKNGYTFSFKWTHAKNLNGRRKRRRKVSSVTYLLMEWSLTQWDNAIESYRPEPSRKKITMLQKKLWEFFHATHTHMSYCAWFNAVLHNSLLFFVVCIFSLF